MRYFITLVGLVLLVVGGWSALDAGMVLLTASKSVDTVFQQLALYVQFYGGGCLCGLAVIAMGVASLDGAQRSIPDDSTSDRVANTPLPPRKSVADSVSADESPQEKSQSPDVNRGLRIALFVILLVLLMMFVATKFSQR